MNPEFQWYEAIGWLGLALILLAYLGLSTGRLRGERLPFPTLNAIGAMAILIAVLYRFDLTWFALAACWLAIGVYGVVRAWRRRREPGES